jgi:hypothetical protein
MSSLGSSGSHRASQNPYPRERELTKEERTLRRELTPSMNQTKARFSMGFEILRCDIVFEDFKNFIKYTYI